MPLGVLRGILMGELARYRSLGVSTLAAILGLLGVLREPYPLGYPRWVLRALAHALPNSFCSFGSRVRSGAAALMSCFFSRRGPRTSRQLHRGPGLSSRVVF